MPLSLPSDAVRRVTGVNFYQVTPHDELLLVTPSGNTNVELYSPTIHDRTGKTVYVRNMGTAKILVTGVACDVDGGADYPVEPSQMVGFKSDGTDWWVSSNDDLTHQIEHVNVSGSVTIDWELGKNHVCSLVGATTFYFSGGKPGGHYNLIVWQTTGGAAYSFGSSVAWSGNVSPDQTTDAGTVDLYAFYYDGDTFIGAGSLYTIV